MNKELKKAVLSSMLVALAIVLELTVKLFVSWFSMPFGGNFIGIFMVPLVIIGFAFGLKYGLISSLVYGIVQHMIAPPGNIVGLSFLMDYYIGFGVYGITGLFKNGLKKPISIIIGVLLAGFLRYIVASLAGVIFWAEYASGNVWFFSFIEYNLGYNLTSTILSLVLVLVMAKRIDILIDNYMGF